MDESMIPAMLDPEETILWEDRPDKLLYILADWRLLVSFFFFTVPASFLLLPVFIMSVLNDFSVYSKVVIISLVLIPFLSTLINVIRRAVHWKFVHYAITNKRVYIESGFIGRDMEVIDFSQEQEPRVSVGPLQKLRHKGTIRICTESAVIGSFRFAGRTSGMLLHVSNPYEVFEIVKRMSIDIRTDVAYPNAMRPDRNPGYQTDFIDKQD